MLEHLIACSGLGSICETAASCSTRSKSDKSQRLTTESCIIKEGRTDYNIELQLLEKTVYRSVYTLQHPSKHENKEDVNLVVSVYGCRYLDAAHQKKGSTIRLHISTLPNCSSDDDVETLSMKNKESLWILCQFFDSTMTVFKRKTLLESAIKFVCSHFTHLSDVVESNSSTVDMHNSLDLIRESDDFIMAGGRKRKIFDDLAYNRFDKERKLNLLDTALKGCFLDSRTAGEIQEILNDRNAGNANIPLKDLINAANRNISHLINMLRERCFLMSVSRIGYDYYNFTPWSVNWLDTAKMKAAMKLVRAVRLLFLHLMHIFVCRVKDIHRQPQVSLAY